MISIGAQIEEVEYELHMRRQVYPRLKNHAARQASEHLRRMEAVLVTLKGLQLQKEPAAA